MLGGASMGRSSRRRGAFGALSLSADVYVATDGDDDIHILAALASGLFMTYCVVNASGKYRKLACLKLLTLVMIQASACKARVGDGIVLFLSGRLPNTTMTDEIVLDDGIPVTDTMLLSVPTVVMGASLVLWLRRENRFIAVVLVEISLTCASFTIRFPTLLNAVHEQATTIVFGVFMWSALMFTFEWVGRMSEYVGLRIRRLCRKQSAPDEGGGLGS